MLSDLTGFNAFDPVSTSKEGLVFPSLPTEMRSLQTVCRTQRSNKEELKGKVH